MTIGGEKPYRMGYVEDPFGLIFEVRDLERTLSTRQARYGAGSVTAF